MTYPPNSQPPGPREAVTVTGMGHWEKLLHGTLIVCTGGLWLPVYLVRNSRAKRRSVTRYR